MSVGDHTNLQDGVLVRTLRASPEGRKIGTTIGSRVTVGHGAVLNGVTVEDEAFIGIGAVLQEGVKVESLVSSSVPSAMRTVWSSNANTILFGSPLKVL